MKKGQTEILIFILIVLVISGGLWVYSLFLNKGVSIDYPYNVEKSQFWSKLWLKHDHTTVYCFDDEKFIPMIDKAKLENKKVSVYYQEFLFRGFLCTSGSDNIGTVVITDIKIEGEK